ncbi:protein nanos [Nasonia vitripennis]|uniref:Nanos-like protein n=1 Tax=Nasonia vitripennis TaxID=7425 RepID=Q68KL9_NASVI|nr:protein nanos [Nasonia vitripennis]AAT94169.1 nanos-like protein [Nasonia vitripennis]
MARVLSMPIPMPQYYGQKSQPNMLFPLNPSLEDELNRLFVDFRVSHAPVAFATDDVWEEFKHNGRDYEYCPDPDEVIVPAQPSKKKNKKPLPNECVFCKNNGEDIKIYKKHLLKDADGKILCPILRNYTCPICGANGDAAHTIKYCPANKQTHSLASMNTLKTLRNSTGRRRSK